MSAFEMRDGLEELSNQSGLRSGRDYLGFEYSAGGQVRIEDPSYIFSSGIVLYIFTIHLYRGGTFYNHPNGTIERI